MTGTTITLPGGVPDGDTRRRDAVVRPLTGRDEELLAAGDDVPARLVTRLLARCVERIGDAGVTEEVARGLTVGDRQYLLLSLRELTFGPKVVASVRCPWRDCAATMNVDFAIPDIPVRAAGDDTAYRVVLSPQADKAARTVTFRLPTGADQEEIGALVAIDPVAALDALLQRCVRDPVEALTPKAKAEIEAAMAAAAYGPQLSLSASCPECGRGFTLPFDIQDFFFGELNATPDLLLREVHRLAFHYHWSEDEILGLTRDRRRRYLDVLADELDGRTDAVG